MIEHPAVLPMIEHPADSFRTKTGTCTITPEQVVLTREGDRGALTAAIFGNSIGRTLLIYTVGGGYLLYEGREAYLDGDVAIGLLMGLFGAFVLANAVMSWNNSATPVIDRAAIRRIDARPPNPPVTRGVFTVHFERNGRLKKRLIMLPGSMENGSEEYARAEALLRQAGLLQ